MNATETLALKLSLAEHMDRMLSLFPEGAKITVGHHGRRPR